MKMRKKMELSLEKIFAALRTYSHQSLPEATRARIYRRVMVKAHETAIQLMLPGFETLPQNVLSGGGKVRIALFPQRSTTHLNSEEYPEESFFIPEQQMELPFPKIIRQHGL